MRYPEFLKAGGRIGYIAPSYGCADEYHRARFEAAMQRFEELGYRNVLGPNCFATEGIGKSNTPEKCGGEINDFFLNDRSDVIISCGGGETMCEDLDFVDFEGIAKADPRWYMGYSDNTNLTFLLPTLCDTASVYGQCAGTFGMREWHPSLEDDFRILTGQTDPEENTEDGAESNHRAAENSGETKKNGSLCFTFHNYETWAWKQPEAETPEPEGCAENTETCGGENSVEESNASEADAPESSTEKEAVINPERLEETEDPLAPWILEEPYRMQVFAPGSTVPTEEKIQASGRLLGGCLDCLCVHCGTRFDRVKEFTEKYKDDGILWFLEACDLNPMSIRRALWQLKEAGWFRYAKGFLIGRALHYDEEIDGMNRVNAVTGILKDLNVPVFLDVDLGHIPPAIPFITGAVAEVTAEANGLTVKQRFC